MVDSTLPKSHQKAAAPTVITISPKTIFYVLTAIAFVLVVISFIGVVILEPYSGNPYEEGSAATDTNLAKVVLRFDVIAEANIPSWYSGVLLLIAAALLGLIAADRHKKHDGYRWHWTALAVMFVGFSLDEIAYLHDGISNWMKQSPNALLQLGWVIPGAIFVLMVGLAFARFILHLPSRTRALFILSAVLFVGGALMLELAEAVYLTTTELQSKQVATLNHIQDFLEMLGVTVFIYALMTYAAAEIRSFRLALRH